MSRISAPAQETAEQDTVPYELELRLVTGDASRAIGRLLAQGNLTPAGAHAVKKAARTIKKGAEGLRGTGSVSATPELNLVAAATAAFKPAALAALSNELSDLGNELESLAEQQSGDEAALRLLDEKLRRLREALSRSSAHRQPSENVSIQVPGASQI